MAQFLIPANTTAGADLVKVLSQPNRHVFGRWYIKYAPGFDFTANNHGGGLTAGSRDFLGYSNYRPTTIPGDTREWASFQFQYQNPTAKPFIYSYNIGMYQDCPSAGNCFGDSYPCVYDAGGSYCTNTSHRPTGGITALPTLTAGQWICYEQEIDMGTPGGSDGIVRQWLNGTIFSDIQNLHLRDQSSTLLQNLFLSLFINQPTHPLIDQRFDNIVVSTQRIGCGTTPPATLVGDLNGDRTVNGFDWTIMEGQWFTSLQPSDINNDGIVNSVDFSLMNQNWGRTI